ncbi:MAG: thiolase domain-containing protein [Chloroflexota bacterium]|nr:thiolase domain-containing protein [Chloroflexota bacterium]
MREVAVVGIGSTPTGELWDQGLRDLAADAARAALQDAGLETVDALYVANAFGASISTQSHLAPLIADYAGLRGIEAIGIEAADASGGAALRTGYLAVASGLVETVMVLGVEKSTDMIGAARVRARAVSLDSDDEALHGATLSALAALLMRRYMYEYELELSAFEGFSINAHANGAKFAGAMYRNILKPGSFARAPMIADPVSLFDGAPDADGAAAVILTSHARAADLVPQPVRLVGSGAATDSLALAERDDPLWLGAIERSTAAALAMAGITRDQIDLFELHDSFTIMAALALEAAGFAERGEGWKLATDASIGLTGDLPIATFGGLKSRGNPVGATGLYQAVEAVMQLRGTAGANQVAQAQIALIQSVGGVGSSAFTHVLAL